MNDLQKYMQLAKRLASQVPALAWAVAFVIAVSLAFVVWLETSSPPYTALYDGLSPVDGGKVIAQLQKLGIPYELQAAGNIILVPVPQLAEARLQLGAAQIPQTNVSTGWDRLENAQMTDSDLAQSTMASQALEAALEQSIETMSGIQSAQVFIAVPPDTPFLTDQPKPTASIVITADERDAEMQGVAIAHLVSGAVPGLSVNQISVATTSGVTVYPAGDASATSTQFATVSLIENRAMERIAALLSPMVGARNFRTDVSADLDFTQEHIHQISYGPAQMIAHQKNVKSDHSGTTDSAVGIPGALSNEPPSPTTATTPPAPEPNAAALHTGATVPDSTKPAVSSDTPHQTSGDLDQTYVTDESDSDIIKPDWTVKSVSISVVLNSATLGSNSVDGIKAALAGAFAYPQVHVNVLTAAFQPVSNQPQTALLAQAIGPVSHALLEVLAAAALLFGVALPIGRHLTAKSDFALAPVKSGARKIVMAVPPATDFSTLRAQATANLAGTAKLLQDWAEENE